MRPCPGGKRVRSARCVSMAAATSPMRSGSSNAASSATCEVCAAASFSSRVRVSACSCCLFERARGSRRIRFPLAQQAVQSRTPVGERGGWLRKQKWHTVEFRERDVAGLAAQRRIRRQRLSATRTREQVFEGRVCCGGHPTVLVGRVSPRYYRRYRGKTRRCVLHRRSSQIVPFTIGWNAVSESSSPAGNPAAGNSDEKLPCSPCSAM